MKRGYFALWRKFEEHPFWVEKRVFSKAEAWIDILWSVQWQEEPQRVVLGMQEFVCHYGESLRSIRTWAERFGWEPSKTHRFFGLCKKMGQIDTKTEQVTTRLSVINYKIYDPRRNTNGTQMEQTWNGRGTEAETDKEGKESQEGKELYLSPKNKPEKPKAKKTEPKKQPNKKHPIPPDYKLDDKHKTYATDKGILPEAVHDIFEGFIIHHQKVGNKYASWYAAWQTWVRNNIKWEKDKPQPIPVTHQNMGASIEELIS